MPSWDVFHGDRLEVERGLTAEGVREALARGDLRDDDLIRPAGTTTPWARIADFPALLADESERQPECADGSAGAPRPALLDEQEFDSLDRLGRTEDFAPPSFADDEDEDDDEPELPADEDEAAVAVALIAEDDDDEEGASASHVALPVAASRDWRDDPVDEDDEAAEFTLARGGPETVEELDLAAMVDVAFQLVLFFLVTATTVLYKSLEVPKPNPESAPAAAAQGRSRNLDDLKNDFILVEIDPAGAMKIDREPVAAEMSALVARLRTAREKTQRRAMLLSADFATPHKHAVLAYDAANEIGLGIAIARPTPKPAP